MIFVLSLVIIENKLNVFFIYAWLHFTNENLFFLYIFLVSLNRTIFNNNKKYFIRYNKKKI